MGFWGRVSTRKNNTYTTFTYLVQMEERVVSSFVFLADSHDALHVWFAISRPLHPGEGHLEKFSECQYMEVDEKVYLGKFFRFAAGLDGETSGKSCSTLGISGTAVLKRCRSDYPQSSSELSEHHAFAN